MPPPVNLRSLLGDIPPLDRKENPPKLKAENIPSLGDISYTEFVFNQDTDQVDSGGNAVVYRARLRNQMVALKRPFPNRTVDTDMMAEMLDEASLWARVDDHPYIATVHDWGLDGGPWIAIEYCDGGTLSERMAEFDFRQRCWTAYAIIDAVAFACGQHGVSHHDLKPDNILFRKTSTTEWDVPTIVDWGLSRELIQHTGSISQATPDYAAPEQFDTLRPEMPVGVHTDVYQLGVLCYELLTGEQPSHLDDDVPPASEVAQKVPPGFDDVLSQALAHDRKDRFEHPLLLREAFTTALRHLVAEDRRGSGTTNEKPIKESNNEPENPSNSSVKQNTNDLKKRVNDAAARLDRDPVFDDENQEASRRDGVNKPITDNEKGADRTWDDIQVSQSDDSIGPTETCNEAALENKKQRSTWSMFRGGPARTGYNPQSSGPQREVTEKWVFETDSSVKSSLAVVGDTVYVGNELGMLYALSADDGTQHWDVEMANWVGVLNSSPAVLDDMVYIGSIDNTISAFSATNGSEQWAVGTYNSVRSSPAVSDGAVFVGADDGKLYALNANSGEKKWDFKTRFQIRSSPAIANNTVYVGSSDCSVHALNAEDGTQQWTVETENRVTSTPAVADGTVYIGDDDGILYALDSTNGAQEWIFDTDYRQISSPAVVNGTVYFASMGEVYALDATDGARQWTVQRDFGAKSSPAVADGTVYMGSQYNSVYALNATNGSERWRFQTKGGVESSPSVADGIVYVGDTDGTVYALDEKEETGIEPIEFESEVNDKMEEELERLAEVSGLNLDDASQ